MVAAINRWDALDVLRGLTIILMLMNLMPGSWQFNYAPLEHARWEGGTLMDMVAPAFLFCIGCAMPLSILRRNAKGAAVRSLLGHVWWRGLILVAAGFVLNLYPTFDFSHVRIPSVLSRIGLCYALTGSLLLLTARRQSSSGTISLRPGLIAGTALFILLSYWALLYFVPSPGFGAPRFDPLGSWPAVVDRAVFGVDHLFPWFAVDGKVLFDPEGILSTWPACFNVLLGALVGIAYARGQLTRPFMTLLAGMLMMGLALLLQGLCPIIKNLWTSSFALLSGGFCLAILGLLMPITQASGLRPLLWPARIFGENPLLAYILCWLLGPLLDIGWIGASAASIRTTGQDWFGGLLEPRAASLLFALCGILLLFAMLLVAHRRRWILKI